MNRPGCLMVVALLTAGPAQAMDGDAPPQGDKAVYDATCSFLVDEVARLDRIVGQDKTGDVLVRKDPASGARLYQRQAEDLRIDYILRPDGSSIISRAHLGPGYIGTRLTAPSLKGRLGLIADIPPRWQTGCDRLEASINTDGSRVTAMTIEAYVD